MEDGVVAVLLSLLTATTTIGLGWRQ